MKIYKPNNILKIVYENDIWKYSVGYDETYYQNYLIGYIFENIVVKRNNDKLISNILNKNHIYEI